jgi:hypothetical protein
MDTYHAAYWSSDPFRLSSSEEEEEIPDTHIGFARIALPMLLFSDHFERLFLNM